MQFNSETNNQDIISDITFWTGVDTNKYTLKQRLLAVNEWSSTVWTWIFEAYGGWQFMDDNVSGVTGTATSGSNDVPYADQTITSGTALYGLPSGTLTVVGVEQKTTSGGPLVPLRNLTYEEFLDRGGDGSFPSTGVPEFYMLQGDVIRLLPSPNFTLATALRVFFDQGMSAFAIGDTAKVPGFASVFHRILSIGPSIDWVSAKGPANKLPNLIANRVDYERRLRSFYSKRFKARFPNRINPGNDLVDEYT